METEHCNMQDKISWWWRFKLLSSKLWYC